MTPIKYGRFLILAGGLILSGCQTTNLQGVAEGLEPLPPQPQAQAPIAETTTKPLAPTALPDQSPRFAPEISREISPQTPVSQDFPDLRKFPAVANSQMTPVEEAAMIVNLLNALESQPSLNASERALYEANKRRLDVIRRTHAIETDRVIEAR